MGRLRAVFFDLDDTLICFPGGFAPVLDGTFAEAVKAGVNPELRAAFARAMWNRSLGLWAAMHCGSITGDEGRYLRIFQALQAIGVDDANLARRMLDRWDELDVNLPYARPEVHHVLSDVRRHAYLGLITDGFKTLQRAKLVRFKLLDYFDGIFISEEVRCSKPFPAIFRAALKRAGCEPDEAVMVGDNPNADVRGALGVGMRAMHLVNGKPTPEGATPVSSLAQVAEALRPWLA